MNYDEWLAAVDSILRSQKRGIKVTDIELAALQEAFDNDVSPVVFAQNPVLPIKMWKPDKRQAPEVKFLPYLISFLLIALVAWWAKSYVGMHFRDKTMETVKYPLKLPVKGENGTYWPEFSHEAEAEASTLIKDFLMTPKDATDIEAVARSMPSQHSFDIEGSVTSKNKYGTAIKAPFEMVLVINPASYVRDAPRFKIKSINLGYVGDTTVWNKTDLLPFDQRRTWPSAKRVPRMQSPAASNVYSGDQD